MIWAVKSCCMKEGKYHQKISDISPIYHRFFATRGDFLKKSRIYLPEPIYRRYYGDVYGNISSPIFLHEISCRLLPIHDISAIYRRYIPIFSSMLIIGLKVIFVNYKFQNFELPFQISKFEMIYATVRNLQFQKFEIVYFAWVSVPANFKFERLAAFQLSKFLAHQIST